MANSSASLSNPVGGLWRRKNLTTILRGLRDEVRQGATMHCEEGQLLRANFGIERHSAPLLVGRVSQKHRTSKGRCQGSITKATLANESGLGTGRPTHKELDGGLREQLRQRPHQPIDIVRAVVALNRDADVVPTIPANH